MTLIQLGETGPKYQKSHIQNNNLKCSATCVTDEVLLKWKGHVKLKLYQLQVILGIRATWGNVSSNEQRHIKSNPSDKVFSFTFHIKWGLQVSTWCDGWVISVLEYLGHWGNLEKLCPNTPNHGYKYTKSYPKS